MAAPLAAAGAAPAATRVVAPPHPLPLARALGRTDYAETLERMRAYTRSRDAGSADEIWLTEHAPVYTQGLAGRAEHVRDTGGVPLVATDRGGQVTYHGPGQLVAYLLIDLARRDLKVRALVRLIEAAVIALLAGYGITGHRREGMPGVYVADAKIAALGLKVSHGRSYHGLSLNVDCDLAPFAGIHPCGYRELEVTSMARLGCRAGLPEVAGRLVDHLCDRLARPAD